MPTKNLILTFLFLEFTAGMKKIQNSKKRGKQMPVSRLPKFMPEDGSKPMHGVYACRTCNQWFASSCGKAGHIKKNPDHQLYSLITSLDLNRPKNAKRPSIPVPSQALLPTNGHHQVTSVLLQSAFAKLREEVTAELDRLEAQLFPVAPAQERQPRKTYVAR